MPRVVTLYVSPPLVEQISHVSSPPNNAACSTQKPPIVPRALSRLTRSTEVTKAADAPIGELCPPMYPVSIEHCRSGCKQVHREIVVHEFEQVVAVRRENGAWRPLAETSPAPRFGRLRLPAHRVLRPKRQTVARAGGCQTRLALPISYFLNHTRSFT